MGTSARLVVDADRLTVLGGRLADLAHTFSTANVTARDLSGVLGHHDLVAAVGEHAIGWDDIRTGVVKDIGFLGEACGRIGETFTELDARLGSQLRGFV